MDMKFKMENDFSALVEEAAFSQIEKALEKVGLTAERYKQQEAKLEELRNQEVSNDADIE